MPGTSPRSALAPGILLPWASLTRQVLFGQRVWLLMISLKMRDLPGVGRGQRRGSARAWLVRAGEAMAVPDLFITAGSGGCCALEGGHIPINPSLTCFPVCLHIKLRIVSFAVANYSAGGLSSALK